jgi:hypothetical protein
MPEYKFGKQTEPIDFEKFESVMENGRFVKERKHKSFLVFLYWFGVRRSEALERVKEDFEVKDETLIVNAPAKKHGMRPFLEAPLDLPFIDLIVDQVGRTPKGERVWPFSSVTAWRIVKRVMPKHYPHFFRLNRATKFLDDPNTTIPEMRAWFGWKTTKAVDSYIGISRRYIRRQSSRLMREVKKARRTSHDASR